MTIGSAPFRRREGENFVRFASQGLQVTHQAAARVTSRGAGGGGRNGAPGGGYRPCATPFGSARRGQLAARGIAEAQSGARRLPGIRRRQRSYDAQGVHGAGGG